MVRCQVYRCCLLWIAVELILGCNMEWACGQSAYSTIPPTLRTKDGAMIPPTEFPSPDSESRMWACLVSLDPITRRGVLRLESRDRMIEFSMLPGGAIFYRGAPASLGDIPPGTMVEVWGYGDEETGLPRNILRMCDHFSVMAFSKHGYRVEQVDPSRNSFTAIAVPLPRTQDLPYVPVLSTGGSLTSQPEIKPIEFSFNPQTDWYIGGRLAESSELAVGQILQINFIRTFYPGPPLITRCTEIWLDQESQDRATRKQLQSFQTFLRDHGFPLQVNAVDDEEKMLQVTLLETGWNDVYRSWNLGEDHAFSASTVSLQMWEPNGGQATPDRMMGVKLVSLEEVPIGYGNGGAKMQFSVPLLYEAYRIGTIIKLYPNNHPVPTLPIEERLPKEFDTFLRP